MTCFLASVFPSAATSAHVAKPVAQLSNPKPPSRSLHKPEIDGVLLEWKQRAAARVSTVNRKAQAKALRLRLYVLCSECARLIDLDEGNPPKREVEGADLARHVAVEHAAWLEVLDIRS
jgi:hypothetical protein